MENRRKFLLDGDGKDIQESESKLVVVEGDEVLRFNLESK